MNNEMVFTAANLKQNPNLEIIANTNDLFVIACLFVFFFINLN